MGSDAQRDYLLSEIANDFTETNFDAFGRLRVSEPYTLFDNSLRFGKCPEIWSEELGGTGASVHDADNSCVNMSVSAEDDFVIRQTKQRFNYQAGKSQYILATGNLNPASGVDTGIGYIQHAATTPFALHNGVCFETIDGVVYCSVYKNGVATRISQSNWNCNTCSNIDFTKSQIYGIDIEWLGVGTVRYFIIIDGKYILVHKQHHANSVENVYMRSGTQPVSYWIRSTGGTGTLRQICSSVMSEGGVVATGFVLGSSTPATISLSTTESLVHAVRLNGSLDTVVEILQANITSTSNIPNGVWRLRFNPTIGGTPNWVQNGDFNVEYWNGTGSEAITNGIVLDFSYINRTDSNASLATFGNLKLGADIDGTRDVFALTFESFSGTYDIAGGLVYRQF